MIDITPASGGLIQIIGWHTIAESLHREKTARGQSASGSDLSKNKGHDGKCAARKSTFCFSIEVKPRAMTS